VGSDAQLARPVPGVLRRYSCGNRAGMGGRGRDESDPGFGESHTCRRPSCEAALFKATYSPRRGRARGVKPRCSILETTAVTAGVHRRVIYVAVKRQFKVTSPNLVEGQVRFKPRVIYRLVEPAIRLRGAPHAGASREVQPAPWAMTATGATARRFDLSLRQWNCSLAGATPDGSSACPGQGGCPSPPCLFLLHFVLLVPTATAPLCRGVTGWLG
jgi:hypothetical protein